VSAAYVISVGATNLRDNVPVNELHGVLKAYNEALVHTFVSLRALFFLRARYLDKLTIGSI